MKKAGCIERRPGVSLRRLAVAAALILALLTFITARANADDGMLGSVSGLMRTMFGESTATVDIVILMTILSLLPSIVIMFTGFTRIIIVLSFMRNAVGMQTTPPNQVMIGLALFLTLFVMWPMASEIYENAYVPYSEGYITQDEFIERTMEPTRGFMLRQTETSNIDFFLDMTSDGETYDSYEDVPTRVLIPAFLLSEIKMAFQIGFFIFIPFLVVDMVVASVLMSMGMMMLPPAMISLPFKILLFVMVNGWQLVMGTLVQSFR